jgi:exonuclease SbcC
MYKEFQERVKKETAELEKEIQSYKDSYSEKINAVKLNSENAEIQFKSIQEEEVLSRLSEIILSDKEFLSEVKISIEKTTEELGKINELLGQAKQDNKLRQGLKSAEERLPRETETKNNAQIKLNAEKDKQPENEKRIKQIDEIQRTLPKYQELKAIITKITADKNTLSESEESLKKLKTQIEKTNLNLEKQKNELKNFDSLDLETSDLKNKEVRLNEKLENLNGLSDIAKEYDVLSLSFSQAQKEYSEKSEMSKAKRESYERLNKAYLDEQAGVLARELKENSPCPVCGSIEHPNPAELSAKAPSKEELSKAKKESEKAEKDTTATSERANTLKGQCTSKKNEIITSAEKLIGTSVFEEIPQVLNDNIKVLKTEIKTVKTKIKQQEEKILQKANLEKSVTDIEKEIKKSEEDIVIFGKKIATLTTQINADINLQTEKAKDLKFKDENEAKAEISKLNKLKEEYEKILKDAERDFERAKTKSEQTLTEILTLKKQIGNSKPLDLEKILNDKKNVEQKQTSLNEQDKAVSSRISNNENILENLKSIVKIKSAQANKHKWLKEISDTANGSVLGKEKIELEIYIQSAYFERIIHRANLRLLQMSNKNFELKRRDVLGKRVQSGLDLDVIDHYNGTVRSVKSLSGGESFLAALALALGLSDEIQNNAGGVRLDSMFVDEGFDSLDETKLSQAIKSLVEISESNRLIGIISHVRGLDEKIDSKIVVTKSPNGGSSATIISE